MQLLKEYLIYLRSIFNEMNNSIFPLIYKRKFHIKSAKKDLELVI